MTSFLSSSSAVTAGRMLRVVLIQRIPAMTNNGKLRPLKTRPFIWKFEVSVFVKQMCIILRASKRKLIIRWDAMEGLGHNSKCNVTYFSYLNKKKCAIILFI